MNTIQNAEPVRLQTSENTKRVSFNLITLFNKFADRQKENHLMWWFINLLVQGVFVLALPAVLIFYYNAPVIVLAVTVLLFFVNMTANMCGSGIRVTLALFFSSLLTNLLMAIIFML